MISQSGNGALTAWDILRSLKPHMSNCHVREVCNVYRALFQDALCTFPTLEVEFERDLSRLLRLARQRGISVFTTDLPAAGKHLDRCLTDGQYKLSGLPLTKRFSSRTPIPKFLRGLYLLVFDESGTLKENCDVEAVFFLRQILYAAKKTTAECPKLRILHEVRNFASSDRALPLPELWWGSVQLKPLADRDAELGRGLSLPRGASSLADAWSVTRSGELADGTDTRESIGTINSQPETEETKEQVISEIYRGFSKSPVYVSRLDSRPTCEHAGLTIFLARLDFVSSLVTSTLGSYDPSEWKFRHGPGAISERTGPSNKYCWPDWSNSLESEYPIADYGFHSFSSWADASDRIESFGSREPYSRMVAVPKTYTKPRLIAAEPCSNQWCQQNLWHYFRERCKRSWIYKFVHFDDQTHNQKLCRAGSRTGLLATVDLSAASDSVTCHAVGQFFRSNPKLLRCLRAARTRLVCQRLAHDVPELIGLRKFSTMGNACTFPVETLIFLCVALAAVLATRRLRPSLREVTRLAREVAVFGDDVIVPTDSRELFSAGLEILDFKINDSKTYWNGSFRESCGIDTFKGQVITPAYWRSAYDGTPASLASVVECSNNFYQRFLLNTSRYLASTVPGGIPQVTMRSGAFGFKTRTVPRNDGFKYRYNDELQRSEIYVRTIQSVQRRSPVGDDTALLQFFTEDPDPYTNWCSGVAQRPKLRSKFRWVPITDLSYTAESVTGTS